MVPSKSTLSNLYHIPWCGGRRVGNDRNSLFSIFDFRLLDTKPLLFIKAAVKMDHRA